MDNLLQLAMQIILCLLIAAIIGAIIGYLLGKMSKCDKEENDEALLQARKKTLHSYEDENNSETAMLAATAETAKGRLKEETARLSKEEKESLSLVSEELKHTEEEETTKEMQAFQKNLEDLEGERPAMLSAPRNGLPDDLKEISGIGLKIEEALNELGIFHFDQIAAWTPENVKWIDNYLVFKGRVDRENWIGQAKLLAVGGSTDFSRRQKKQK